MKIVIDSNRVLAAMIKESTTRELLFDDYFEFTAPDFLLSEVCKYQERVLKITGLEKNDFEILLALFFGRIEIIPQTTYESFMRHVKDEISDEKDIAYIATCLAMQAEAIWTHDPHFLEQKRVKVFTNIDMLRLAGKNEK